MRISAARVAVVGYAFTVAIVCSMLGATRGTDAGEPSKTRSKYPITLSLKKPVPKPARLKDLPPVVYEKKGNAQFKETAWILKLDILEDGKPKVMTIRGGQRMKIPKDKGEITRESGSWGFTFALFMVAYKGAGQGTLRLALFDPRGFEENEERRKKDVQLSNWVSMPVKLQKE